MLDGTGPRGRRTLLRHVDLTDALRRVSLAPAITLPNDFGRCGLPAGIEWPGRADEERRLAAIARAYQALIDSHTPQRSI